MDELAKRIAALADQYGPSVIDAAKEAARMQAYSSVQGHIIGLILCAALILLARWCWRKNVTDDTDIPFGRIGACILFGIGGIVGTVAITGLTDPWLWSTFKNPELWIAKKTLGL